MENDIQKNMNITIKWSKLKKPFPQNKPKSADLTIPNTNHRDLSKRKENFWEEEEEKVGRTNLESLLQGGILDYKRKQIYQKNSRDLILYQIPSGLFFKIPNLGQRAPEVVSMLPVIRNPCLASFTQTPLPPTYLDDPARWGRRR